LIDVSTLLESGLLEVVESPAFGRVGSTIWATWLAFVSYQYLRWRAVTATHRPSALNLRIAALQTVPN
jgi:hypothetical protein